VTRLRKMMLAKLQRRNYSEHTTRYYIRTVGCGQWCFAWNYLRIAVVSRLCKK
jgi:hypothetical protein